MPLKSTLTNWLINKVLPPASDYAPHGNAWLPPELLEEEQDLFPGIPTYQLDGPVEVWGLAGSKAVKGYGAYAVSHGKSADPARHPLPQSGEGSVFFRNGRKGTVRGINGDFVLVEFPEGRYHFNANDLRDPTPHALRRRPAGLEATASVRVTAATRAQLEAYARKFIPAEVQIHAIKQLGPTSFLPPPPRSNKNDLVIQVVPDRRGKNTIRILTHALAGRADEDMVVNFSVPSIIDAIASITAEVEANSPTVQSDGILQDTIWVWLPPSLETEHAPIFVQVVDHIEAGRKLNKEHIDTRNLEAIYELERKVSSLSYARKEGPLNDRAERSLILWRDELIRRVGDEIKNIYYGYEDWLDEAATVYSADGDPQIIGAVEAEARKLRTFGPVTADKLGKALVLMHEALTLAHHNASMGSYVYAPRAPRQLEKFVIRELDRLSNMDTTKWDQEVSKLTSLPRGASIRLRADDLSTQPKEYELGAVVHGWGGPDDIQSGDFFVKYNMHGFWDWSVDCFERWPSLQLKADIQRRPFHTKEDALRVALELIEGQPPLSRQSEVWEQVVKRGEGKDEKDEWGYTKYLCEWTLIKKLPPRAEAKDYQDAEAALAKALSNLSTIYNDEYLYSRLLAARADGPLPDRAERELARVTESLVRRVKQEILLLRTAYDAWVDEARNVYHQDINSGGPTMRRVKESYDALKTYRDTTPATLKDDIVLMHKALTTAHHNASMGTFAYAPDRSRRTEKRLTKELDNLSDMNTSALDARVKQLLSLPRGASVRIVASMADAQRLIPFYELEYKWQKLRQARKTGPLPDKAERLLAEYEQKLDALTRELTAKAEGAMEEWLLERLRDMPSIQDPELSSLSGFPCVYPSARVTALEIQKDIHDATGDTVPLEQIYQVLAEERVVRVHIQNLLPDKAKSMATQDSNHLSAMLQGSASELFKELRQRDQRRVKTWTLARQAFVNLRHADSLPLDKRIAAFHQALNVAHNEGSMSEHIFDVRYEDWSLREELVTLLDNLSNTDTTAWDAELDRLLSAPRGASLRIVAGKPEVWYNITDKSAGLLSAPPELVNQVVEVVRDILESGLHELHPETSKMLDVDLSKWTNRLKNAREPKDAIRVSVIFTDLEHGDSGLTGTWNRETQELIVIVPRPQDESEVAAYLSGIGKRNIEHELEHYMQDVISDVLPIPDFGSPLDTSGGLPVPSSQFNRQEEAGKLFMEKLREFYPILKNTLFEYNEIGGDVRAFIAQDPFFESLKESDPNLWQKAVKLFVTEASRTA